MIHINLAKNDHSIILPDYDSSSVICSGEGGEKLASYLVILF